METIEELRAQLAATDVEAEQAGLLDAIGIQLTLQNQPLEALEFSSRALEIRARLADRDTNAELPFAASLFNRAGHLRALKRDEEAVATYALALRVSERHPVESRARSFRIAEGLAAALAELRCYDMAARFQGAAVHLLLEADSHEPEIHSAIASLAAYLDFLDDDVPARRLQLSTDAGLLSFRTVSLAAAQQLDQRATKTHVEGRPAEAIVWATRTVRYCDLFASADARMAALSAENLRRIAVWSPTESAGIGLASLARLKSAPPVTLDSPDRRFWCCSIRGLLLMIEDLIREGIPASDVHTLAEHLRKRRIYPARDYGHHCQPRLPDIFITYDWRQNFVGLYDMIEGALVYMGQALFQARPDLEPRRIRHLVFDEIGVWIDFVFIDQLARDLGSEVRDAIPRVIDSSDVHFVLSDTALVRSWCCYELALFNRRPVAPAWQHEVGGHLARPLLSFVSQEQAHQFGGFRQTATSVPEDKEVIEKYLSEEFPEGLLGVDLLLFQAGLLDRRITPGFAVPPFAEETMRQAADKWLAR